MIDSTAREPRSGRSSPETNADARVLLSWLCDRQSAAKDGGFVRIAAGKLGSMPLTTARRAEAIAALARASLVTVGSDGAVELRAAGLVAESKPAVLDKLLPLAW